MEGTSRIIEAVTGLIWPLAAVVVIWKAWPLIRDTLSGRGFTLEIGGFKFSAQEATEQLQKQIGDLQDKIVELESRGKIPSHGRDDRELSRLSILWVDDTPSQIAFEADALRREGYQVKQVSSTEEALAVLDREAVDILISDMGRTEAAVRHREAGIQLLRELRRDGSQIPVAFYTSAKAIDRHEEEANQLGVIAMTSSFTTLAAAIRRLGEVR